MKRVLHALLGLALGALLGRYGPAVLSYAVIPSDFGYFRYYENYDLDGKHWEYWTTHDGNLVSGSIYHNRFIEEWEIVPGKNGEDFLYDDRGEFDRIAQFDRTELIICDQDGNEEHYPRVFDLWEIWLQQIDHWSDKPSYGQIAVRNAEYNALIAKRMIKYGVSIAPGAEARRRPPIGRAAPEDDDSSAKPMLAVTEFGMWENTGTVFALYADGTAICRSIPENPKAPYHLVDPSATAGLLSQLCPVDLESFEARYELSNATDQTITTFWLSGKKVEVYGPWQEPLMPPRDATDASESDLAAYAYEREQWQKQPASLHQALLKIDALRRTPGARWQPDQVEVQFSGFENTGADPVLWPKDWPGLYAPGSKKRQGSRYSVFIHSGDFERLNRFLESLPETTPVMIDLNQMYPRVRFPFPGESEWLK